MPLGVEETGLRDSLWGGGLGGRETGKISRTTSQFGVRTPAYGHVNKGGRFRRRRCG